MAESLNDDEELDVGQADDALEEEDCGHGDVELPDDPEATE